VFGKILEFEYFALFSDELIIIVDSNDLVVWSLVGKFQVDRVRNALKIAVFGDSVFLVFVDHLLGVIKVWKDWEKEIEFKVELPMIEKVKDEKNGTEEREMITSVFYEEAGRSQASLNLILGSSALRIFTIHLDLLARSNLRGEIFDVLNPKDVKRDDLNRSKYAIFSSLKGIFSKSEIPLRLMSKILNVWMDSRQNLVIFQTSSALLVLNQSTETICCAEFQLSEAFVNADSEAFSILANEVILVAANDAQVALAVFSISEKTGEIKKVFEESAYHACKIEHGIKYFPLSKSEGALIVDDKVFEIEVSNDGRIDIVPKNFPNVFDLYNIADTSRVKLLQVSEDGNEIEELAVDVTKISNEIGLIKVPDLFLLKLFEFWNDDRKQYSLGKKQAFEKFNVMQLQDAFETGSSSIREGLWFSKINVERRISLHSSFIDFFIDFTKETTFPNLPRVKIIFLSNHELILASNAIRLYSDQLDEELVSSDMKKIIEFSNHITSIGKRNAGECSATLVYPPPIVLWLIDSFAVNPSTDGKELTPVNQCLISVLSEIFSKRVELAFKLFREQSDLNGIDLDLLDNILVHNHKFINALFERTKFTLNSFMLSKDRRLFVQAMELCSFLVIDLCSFFVIKIASDIKTLSQALQSSFVSALEKMPLKDLSSNLSGLVYDFSVRVKFYELLTALELLKDPSGSSLESYSQDEEFELDFFKACFSYCAKRGLFEILFSSRSPLFPYIARFLSEGLISNLCDNWRFEFWSALLVCKDYKTALSVIENETNLNDCDESERNVKKFEFFQT
jgi:hypothetical protein